MAWDVQARTLQRYWEGLKVCKNRKKWTRSWRRNSGAIVAAAPVRFCKWQHVNKKITDPLSIMPKEEINVWCDHANGHTKRHSWISGVIATKKKTKSSPTPPTDQKERSSDITQVQNKKMYARGSVLLVLLAVVGVGVTRAQGPLEGTTVSSIFRKELV